MPKYRKRISADISLTANFLLRADPNVGTGLLAKAVGQSVHLVLIHRFREQARSHRLIGVNPLFMGSSQGRGA